MIDKNRLNSICKKLNIDSDRLPDRLLSTLFRAICEACGASADDSDNLSSTLIRKALSAKGIVPGDNDQITDMIEQLDKALDDVGKVEIQEQHDQMICPVCGKKYQVERYYKKHLEMHKR